MISILTCVLTACDFINSYIFRNCNGLLFTPHQIVSAYKVSYVAFILEGAGTSRLGAQSLVLALSVQIFSEMTGLFSFLPNSSNTQWFWIFDFHNHYINKPRSFFLNKPHSTLNFPPPLIKVLIALSFFFFTLFITQSLQGTLDLWHFQWDI